MRFKRLKTKNCPQDGCEGVDCSLSWGAADKKARSPKAFFSFKLGYFRVYSRNWSVMVKWVPFCFSGPFSRKAVPQKHPRRPRGSYWGR